MSRRSIRRTSMSDDSSGASPRHGSSPRPIRPAPRRLLREGLALWRGHAFEEFVYEGWAQAEISRLEELRLEATEMRVEADLRLGLSGELVSELKGLVRQHPLRERFVASLMLALYRCGRNRRGLRFRHVARTARR